MVFSVFVYVATYVPPPKKQFICGENLYLLLSACHALEMWEWSGIYQGLNNPLTNLINTTYWLSQYVNQ